MAHYYCDSSGLVKRYINEAGTSWMIGLCAATSGNTIYTASISAAEVCAAVFRRSRSGTITVADAQAAAVQLTAELDVRLQVVEITRPIVETAMVLTQRHYLRGYDSVQLAAALALQSVRQALGFSPITFVSADDELNAAATAEGFQVENPNWYP